MAVEATGNRLRLLERGGQPVAALGEDLRLGGDLLDLLRRAVGQQVVVNRHQHLGADVHVGVDQEASIVSITPPPMVFSIGTNPQVAVAAGDLLEDAADVRQRHVLDAAPNFRMRRHVAESCPPGPGSRTRSGFSRANEPLINSR